LRFRRGDFVLEIYVRAAAGYVALLAEALGALVIAVALVRVIWRYIRNLRAPEEDLSRIRIRLQLGQSLALALELLVAADILRTALTPTWDAVGRLAAIVAIRTVLNYFLQREIEHERNVLRRAAPDS